MPRAETARRHAEETLRPGRDPPQRGQLLILLSSCVLVGFQRGTGYKNEGMLERHRRHAMSTRDDLLELERDAWRALSTDGETAARHYAQLLAEDVLMLLPGGLVIDDRKRSSTPCGASWDGFELTDERVLELDDRTAVVAYRATATDPTRTTKRCSTAPTCARTALGSWRCTSRRPARRPPATELGRGDQPSPSTAAGKVALVAGATRGVPSLRRRARRRRRVRLRDRPQQPPASIGDRPARDDRRDRGTGDRGRR